MSDRPEDVIDVALRVAAALESVGARYFVGGSLASSLDGQPRATNDIDVVIDIPIGKLGALSAALGSDFEVDRDMLREAVLHGRCANIFYLPQVLKIDLFGHAHGPYDESEFSRCRAVPVRDGRTLIVKAPEDTVLRKMPGIGRVARFRTASGTTSSAFCARREATWMSTTSVPGPRVCRWVTSSSGRRRRLRTRQGDRSLAYHRAARPRVGPRHAGFDQRGSAFRRTIPVIRSGSRNRRRLRPRQGEASSIASR